jgi:RimJ/RimL family protein N-acetyltransferase
MKWPFTIGPVTILPTLPEHLPAFWEILWRWDDFWADKDLIVTQEVFCLWYNKIALDSLTGLENGQVVGGAYLDAIHPGAYATVNIFKAKGYLNPRMVSAILRQALPYWFEKYSLEVIRGITRHKAAVALARRIGFRREGVFRHWAQVNGVWRDYELLSITRGEVC